MTQPPLGPEMFDPVCPSPLVPFRIGDKWATLVLRCLEGGPRRFSELKVPLRGITSKSLTQSLRGLERDGFVAREEPGRYALTPSAGACSGRSMPPASGRGTTGTNCSTPRRPDWRGLSPRCGSRVRAGSRPGRRS